MSKKNVKRVVLLSILFIITIVVFIMYSFPVLYLSFELNEDGESYSVTGALPFKKNIDIPSYYRRLPVTKVGKNAFSYSSSLRTVTFKDDSQITIIGDYAFFKKHNLIKITIPDSVQSIGYYAFSGRDNFDPGMSLTEINFGEKSQLKSIGKGAFEHCNKMTNILIPTQVISIGAYAFKDCSSLTSIIIPNSVISIGVGAFNYCVSLENIEVSEENANYKSLEGVLLNKAETELIRYPIGNKKTSYSIIQSVEYIGDYAFYGCNSLTSITIPDSVSSIGKYAFAGNWNTEVMALTSVTFGKNSQLTSIGDYAFYYCRNLTEITIPDSVTIIGRYAFDYCSSLTSITLPVNLIEIGRYPFSSSSITSVFFNSITPQLINYSYIDNSRFKIYVPDGSVAAYKAESGWKNIYSQSIIDEDGFAIENDILIQYVGKALQITIPDNVTGIDSYAFSGVKGEVMFGEASAITEIGDFAFSGYRGESMTIPAYITSIGSSAFAQARSLTSLVIESETPPSLGRDVFDFTHSALKIYVPSKSVNTYKGASGWQDYSDKIFAME